MMTVQQIIKTSPTFQDQQHSEQQYNNQVLHEI